MIHDDREFKLIRMHNHQQIIKYECYGMIGCIDTQITSPTRLWTEFYNMHFLLLVSQRKRNWNLSVPCS